MELQRGWLLVAAVAVLIPLCWRSPKAPEALCAFAAAKPGSHVKVRFELRNGDDGTTVDASREVDFVLGATESMEFLDASVEGMEVGETKESRFGGDAGFGERDQDWVVPYERNVFGDAELEVGMRLELSGSQATIAAFNDTVVTLDFNHPLAGLNVTLVATLISCEAPCETGPVIVDPISPGDGATFPQRGDRVRVHCVASYADDGEIFYSSRDQGQPYEFELGAGKVIAGLEIGIRNVSLGGSARLTIPADLAYGRQSSAVQVPVQRDVVYEVELLSIG